LVIVSVEMHYMNKSLLISGMLAVCLSDQGLNNSAETEGLDKR